MNGSWENFINTLINICTSRKTSDYGFKSLTFFYPCIFLNFEENCQNIRFWTILLCSPSEGQCCKSDCIFVSSTEDLTCAPEGECSLAAKCDGTSAYCPSARQKKDGLECAAGTKVNRHTIKITLSKKLNYFALHCSCAALGLASNLYAQSSTKKSASRMTESHVRWESERGWS